jgi:hypothetical protein
MKAIDTFFGEVFVICHLPKLVEYLAIILPGSSLMSPLSCGEARISM